MAARRLLIVMLILLGVSTLAAALVPPKSLRSGTTTTTATQPGATTPAQPPPQPEGEFVPVPIVVGGKTVPVVACRSSNDKRRCSPIRVGDQISLAVRSRRADQLEIPAFGLVKAATPDAPALFDLLPTQAGTYAINFVGANQLAAEIKVAPAEKRTGGGRGGA